MPRRPYTVHREWGSTAAGGASVREWTNDQGRTFFIQQMQFAALTAAAVGNVPAGTPFIRDWPGYDVAAPSLSEITLDIEIGGKRVATDPLNALLSTGDGRNPSYRQVEYQVPVGARIKITLGNDSAVAAFAILELVGYLED